MKLCRINHRGMVFLRHSVSSSASVSSDLKALYKSVIIIIIFIIIIAQVNPQIVESMSPLSGNCG